MKLLNFYMEPNGDLTIEFEFANSQEEAMAAKQAALEGKPVNQWAAEQFQKLAHEASTHVQTSAT